MVKIVKQRKLDKDKATRAKNLVEIANREVGDGFEASVSSSGNVRLVEKGAEDYPMNIWVMSASHHRVISLDCPRYESRAVNLAQAYEDAGLGKFTVEAHY